MTRTWLVALVAAAVALLPSLAAAQDPDRADGAVIRVNGDYTVPRGQSADLVVVIDGDLTLLGDAERVVVVNGEARVEGQVTRHITVVRGDLALRPTARVKDVFLFRSGLEQEPGAVVTGEIERQGAWFWPGIAILLGAIFIIGSVLIAIAVAVVYAAFGGRQLGDAAAMMTARPAESVGIGIGIAILGPVVAALIMATVVGIPLGISLLLVALPVLGLLGAVVAATWVGFMILGRGETATRSDRPFGPALLGIAILAALMILPGIGLAAVVLLSIWGMGALVYRVVRPSAAPARRSPDEAGPGLEQEPEVVVEER